jgi:hypothetical protein
VEEEIFWVVMGSEQGLHIRLSPSLSTARSAEEAAVAKRFFVVPPYDMHQHGCT